jgi:hypothetical protein
MNHQTETTRRLTLGLAPRPHHLNRKRRHWARWIALGALAVGVAMIAVKVPEL